MDEPNDSDMFVTVTVMGRGTTARQSVTITTPESAPQVAERIARSAPAYVRLEHGRILDV